MMMMIIMVLLYAGMMAKLKQYFERNVLRYLLYHYYILSVPGPGKQGRAEQCDRANKQNKRHINRKCNENNE